MVIKHYYFVSQMIYWPHMKSIIRRLIKLAMAQKLHTMIHLLFGIIVLVFTSSVGELNISVQGPPIFNILAIVFLLNASKLMYISHLFALVSLRYINTGVMHISMYLDTSHP